MEEKYTPTPTELGTGSSPRKSIEERLADLEACCYYFKLDRLMQLTHIVKSDDDKFYKYKNLNYLLENLDFISSNFNFDDGGMLQSRFMDIFNYMIRVDYKFDDQLCEKFIEFLLKHNCFGGGNIINLNTSFKNSPIKGTSYENIKKIIDNKINKTSDGKKRSKKKRSKKRSKRKI